MNLSVPVWVGIHRKVKMKESEILRTILQDEKIGWWVADMTRLRIRFSEMLCRLLGLSESEIGFDEYRELVVPSYRDYAFIDIALTRERMPRDRVYPVSVKGREIWFDCRMLKKETDANGDITVIGYIRQIDSPSDASGVSAKARINDLLFRLNSISHTLLSLLHTETVGDAIDKILSDILTMFHAGRAYIIEFDWEHRMHACTYEVTAGGVDSEREFINQFRMDDMEWWTDYIARGKPLALSSLSELPPEAAREREVLEAQDIKSMIVMPLASRDKVWGYAGIDIVEDYRRWTNEDCQWFSSLVNIISLCLDLQRSEQTAQEERTYLQSLYRHMPIGYVRLRVLYDGEGEPCDYLVLDSNFAADKIAGAGRKHYVGRTAVKLGLDVKDFLPDMMQVLRTGKFVERDSMIGPDKRFVHAILYTMRKDEIICLFSDTTEVRKAHEAIYRNEKLLRNIFDNIQVGMELYDKDGRLVDINNKDMEIFGVRAKEDVLGINFYDNPNVPQEIIDQVRAGVDQVFRINYPFDHLGKYYRSGKTGYLEIFTTVNMLYDLQGNLVNFMLINMDNTEITRAHSRLAEFESSFSLVSRFGKVGYCRFDLLSKEGYGVPQWYRNLGEKEDTPLDEVIGVYSHVDPADRTSILECIRRVVADEIESFGLDLRINSGENETWTRINVIRNPMNNDPSKIEMVCVNYDITELKQTERYLIEAKNKAEVSDRLKSAFLANMSHEIRTPLNAIVGFSNLLSETGEAREKAEYMEIVQENNELLLKLISDILDLSKIEAGTFEFHHTTFDVNQMCQEIVRSLGLKVQERSVELLFGEHQDECRIVSDKSRLIQVLTNFINNALKFTQQGSVTIGYQTSESEIRFYVRDTGTGIPAKDQPTIFDRFVKLNNFVQGTGLGLSICKSIIEQLGGHIGVESAEGQGSCFWFALPRTYAGDEAENTSACPSEKRGGKLPVLLIAEDTDSNFLLMSLTLRKKYDIVRAHDNLQTVQLCYETVPDLVLMDVDMPGSDGLDAVREIRRLNSRVPIIAVSAYANDHGRLHALKAGCSDYLSKPVAGELLQKKLREHLKF